jgi:hypothetical protein
LTTTVQLKRGTRAKIDALASTGGLLEGEPLFITDEKKLAVASTNNAYTTAAMLDSNGVVLTPNRPVFQGYFGSYTGNATNYSPQLLTDFATNVIVNSTNSSITVPITGKYLVQAHQLVNTTSTQSYLSIRQNGGTFKYAYSNNDDSYDLQINCIINLSANDVVSFYYQGTTTYSWTGPHSSVFLTFLG